MRVAMLIMRFRHIQAKYAGDPALQQALELKMSEKIHAELFIRLLSEALQADRAIRKTRLADRTTTFAGRITQLFRSDIARPPYTSAAMQGEHRRASAEPQDLWFE
jgi:hypothetical protein